ncbi:MAG: hypothetical protein P8Z00_00990, partial [Anaerolineales bacterium]
MSDNQPPDRPALGRFVAAGALLLLVLAGAFWILRNRWQPHPASTPQPSPLSSGTPAASGDTQVMLNSTGDDSPVSLSIQLSEGQAQPQAVVP